MTVHLIVNQNHVTFNSDPPLPGAEPPTFPSSTSSLPQDRCPSSSLCDLWSAGSPPSPTHKPLPACAQQTSISAVPLLASRIDATMMLSRLTSCRSPSQLSCSPCSQLSICIQPPDSAGQSLCSPLLAPLPPPSKPSHTPSLPSCLPQHNSEGWLSWFPHLWPPHLLSMSTSVLSTINLPQAPFPPSHSPGPCLSWDLAAPTSTSPLSFSHLSLSRDSSLPVLYLHI